MAIVVSSDASAFKRTANLPTSTSFSMWGWFMITTDRNTFSGFLGLADNSSGSPSTQHQIATDTDGTTLELVGSGGATTSLGALSLNTWYFAAMTCAASGAGNLKGYVRAITANTLTAVTGTSGSFSTGVAEWGRDGFTGEYLNGRIHACGMADAALSVDELLELSFFHEPQLDGIRSLNVFYPTIVSVNTDATTDMSGNARNATATVGALADSPPLLWRAPSPPWNLPAAGGGSDVTLALTGQVITGALGTLVPALSLALSGQALASSAGTMIPATSKALSGSALASSAGTLTPALSLSLTGSALTGSLGTLVPTLSIPLTGLLITIGQGSLTAPGGGGDVTAALTGISISAAQGTLAPSTSKALSGSALAMSLGTLVPGTSKALTGSALSSAQGTIGATLSVAMVGSVITASTGTLTNPSAITGAIDNTRIVRVTVRMDLRVATPEALTLHVGTPRTTIH